jgi:transposase
VERWFHDFLERKVAETKNTPCPQVMGIDEHFFTKKAGYATTICNLRNHKVYDITLGRSEKALDGYFARLKGKDKVQVVVMDLSATYRNIVRLHFPNAKIVSDRFHVIRLVNYHFLKVWADIDPVGRKNRGLLSLMRRHKWNLAKDQVANLYRYLEGFPGLKAIYDFKQDLTGLLLTKKQTQYQCRRLIPIFLDYIEKLKDSMLDSLITLGKTLESWREEVVRMFRFTKNNGIVEGFHNKMETISRRAYGFKNFENYRLRVRALCC